MRILSPTSYVWASTTINSCLILCLIAYYFVLPIRFLFDWIQVLFYSIYHICSRERRNSDVGPRWLWKQESEMVPRKKVEGLSSSSHFLQWWKAYDRSPKKNKLLMFNMKLQKKELGRFASGLGMTFVGYPQSR